MRTQTRLQRGHRLPACLPRDWPELTLGTLRHKLFWLPGELTTHKTDLRADWADRHLDRAELKNENL